MVDHDEHGTTAALLFDNLVHSGATDPSRPTTDHRSAPFGWQNITARAVGRDPGFQPSWLPDAVELLAAAGTDVTINTTSAWGWSGDRRRRSERGLCAVADHISWDACSVIAESPAPLGRRVGP